MLCATARDERSVQVIATFKNCERRFLLHVPSGLRCPKLDPPANGYFIGDDCRRDIHAACGVRCHPGHVMRGSPIRVCQRDRKWSGVDTTCHREFQELYSGTVTYTFHPHPWFNRS